MPALYHADSPDALARDERIEGFTLIYHRPSGQTHLLGEAAAAILDLLSDAPGTAGDHVARLGLGDAPGAEQGVADRLAELIEAGLVRGA